MASAFAVVPLLCVWAAQALASTLPTTTVNNVLPYSTFNAAFQLVEYCTVENLDMDYRRVSDYCGREECELNGGSWETRPGFQPQPELVYAARVQASNAEARASGRAVSWVLRVAEDAKYYESRYDDWERLTGASMDDMHVYNRRLYLQVHTTSEKVDALVETGQFDVAMAIPVELLVHSGANADRSVRSSVLVARAICRLSLLTLNLLLAGFWYP